MFRGRVVANSCLALLLAIGLSTSATGDLLPGDADNNDVTNVSDVVFMIGFVFGDGVPPLNQRCADVNDDCALNVSDVVELIEYVFGADPDPLTLGCLHQDFNPGCYSIPIEKGAGKASEALRDRGCLEDPPDSTEYMDLEYSGNDLHIFHYNAYYQCCLGYAVEFDWQDDRHVTVIESDTNLPPCPCECYFNLEAVVYDLYVMEPTTYVVTLVGVYGDTVGVDSITIGGNGTMYAEVLGNDLHVHHLDAYYQCCLGYLVEYEIDGSNITAVESDTGMPCDCYCYFNLETVLYDLENGEYTVTLVGIDGEIVGVQTVVVEADFGLMDYSWDGCLEQTRTYDPPDIEYLYNGGTLEMHHYNAWYNCGSIFVVQFEAAGDTLRFFELNVNDDCAYCMCYFYLNAAVTGIEPGSYVAEIWGRDCMSPLELVDRREIELGP
jgi:hypothetical protein